MKPSPQQNGKLFSPKKGTQQKGSEKVDRPQPSQPASRAEQSTHRSIKTQSLLTKTKNSKWQPHQEQKHPKKDSRTRRWMRHICSCDRRSTDEVKLPGHEHQVVKVAIAITARGTGVHCTYTHRPGYKSRCHVQLAAEMPRHCSCQVAGSYPLLSPCIPWLPLHYCVLGPVLGDSQVVGRCNIVCPALCKAGKTVQKSNVSVGLGTRCCIGL